MIPASTYLPSTSSSTIAASSIHGTGAQNLVSALCSGRSAVSGTAFGPDFSSRRRASSLVSPAGSGTSLTEEEAMILKGTSYSAVRQKCQVFAQNVDRYRRKHGDQRDPDPPIAMRALPIRPLVRCVGMTNVAGIRPFVPRVTVVTL